MNTKITEVSDDGTNWYLSGTDVWATIINNYYFGETVLSGKFALSNSGKYLFSFQMLGITEYITMVIKQ